MNFTLDSVTQVIEALEENNKNKTVRKEPFFTTNLKDLTDQNTSLYYFGIFTNGSGENCKFYFDAEEVIEIQQNSQIYLLFTHINQNYDATQLENLKGQFRGFKIVVSS
jgi:hypothetical protein